MEEMRARPLRIAGRIGGASFVLGLALLLMPDLVLLDRITPFAQLVAFRPLMLTVVAALLAWPVIVLLVRRRARWVVAGVIAVLVVCAGTLVSRAVPDGAETGPGLTVLAVNVYEGDASVDETAVLIAADRPDLVSIPESGAAFRARLSPLVEPLGYRVYGSTGDGVLDVAGVTALAHEGLGELEASVDAGTRYPSVVLTGGTLGALRFVAFHSVAPVPATLGQWRSDLAHVATWCAGPTPAIVAGDFNASADHSSFRSGTAGCADAAEQAGAGLVGTWPAEWPRPTGTQIDHVLLTPGMAAESFAVHDVTGSDHRAVVTRLGPTAG